MYYDMFIYRMFNVMTTTYFQLNKNKHFITKQVPNTFDTFFNYILIRIININTFKRGAKILLSR